MKFCVIYQQTSHNAQSPVRVVEQATGRGSAGSIVTWIANMFVVWRTPPCAPMLTICCTLFAGGRVFTNTGDIREGDLTESTLLEYVRFQSGQQPRLPLPSSHDRVAVVDRAIRNEIPDAPCQIARGFHQAFLPAKAHGPWPAAAGHEPICE